MWSRIRRPSESQVAGQRSREIEKEIAQDKEKLEKEAKILLLGAGQSGKSTIVKQMQ